LQAPSRADEPAFALYGSRAERSAAAGALSLRLCDRLGIGAGVTLTPRLLTPTVVSYEPGRGETPRDDVVVDLERELAIEAAATFGVHARPSRLFALAVSYREAIATGAEGPNDTRAGALILDDRIDFYDFAEPEELALGAAVFPTERWSVSLDAVLARWSRYRTIHDEVPEPRFSDVVNVRGGVEHEPVRAVSLRAGYAFEPSPVPEQRGETNLLDADRHVLALGAGFDLRARGLAPLRIDGHLRAHVLHRQFAEKDPALLRDVNESVPGTQIGHLGHPGFEAGGYVLEGGLTLTVFLRGMR
jgi:hypothetical protein